MKELKNKLSKLFNKEIKHLVVDISPISPYSEDVIVLITFTDGTTWDTFFELDSDEFKNDGVYKMIKFYYEYEMLKN